MLVTLGQVAESQLGVVFSVLFFAGKANAGRDQVESNVRVYLVK